MYSAVCGDSCSAGLVQADKEPAKPRAEIGELEKPSTPPKEGKPAAATDKSAEKDKLQIRARRGPRGYPCLRLMR
jgi:hypothetical protein